MAKFFALLVALLMIAAAPPYFIDILKGKTKPERATWLIWSLLGVIAFVSQVNLHGKWSLVYIGLDAIGNIAVFILSLKYGIGGWKMTDKIALFIAFIGVAVSLVYRNPLLALSGVILADLSGAALTIVKTYNSPSTETTITWIFLGTASFLGALSVGKLDIGLLLYPAYLTIAAYSVVAAQLLGRMRQKT